jgi:hypothetical protein
MVFSIEPKHYSSLYDVFHKSLDSLELLDSTQQSLEATDLNVRFVATPLPSLKQLQLVFPTQEFATKALGLIPPQFSVSFLQIPDRLLQPSYLHVHGRASSYNTEINGDSVHLTHRNFLLSPPGSPPIGWVQTKEDLSPGGLLLFQLDSTEQDASDLDTQATHTIQRKQQGNQSITTIQFESGFPSIVIHEMETHQPELDIKSAGLLDIGGGPKLPRTRIPGLEDDW